MERGFLRKCYATAKYVNLPLRSPSIYRKPIEIGIIEIFSIAEMLIIQKCNYTVIVQTFWAYKLFGLLIKICAKVTQRAHLIFYMTIEPKMGSEIHITTTTKMIKQSDQ